MYRSQSPAECKWKNSTNLKLWIVSSFATLVWYDDSYLRKKRQKLEIEFDFEQYFCSSSLFWRHQACQIISVGSFHFRLANHRRRRHLQTEIKRIFNVSFFRSLLSLSLSLSRSCYRYFAWTNHWRQPPTEHTVYNRHREGKRERQDFERKKIWSTILPFFDYGQIVHSHTYIDINVPTKRKRNVSKSLFTIESLCWLFII